MADKQRTMSFKKKPREMVSADRLKALRTDLSFTLHKMGEQLGVSGSTISEYESNGKMPKLVGLAVEALERRRGKSYGHKLMLVKLDPTEQEMLDRLGIQTASINEAFD